MSASAAPARRPREPAAGLLSRLSMRGFMSGRTPDPTDRLRTAVGRSSLCAKTGGRGARRLRSQRGSARQAARSRRPESPLPHASADRPAPHPAPRRSRVALLKPQVTSVPNEAGSRTPRGPGPPHGVRDPECPVSLRAGPAGDRKVLQPGEERRFIGNGPIYGRTPPGYPPPRARSSRGPTTATIRMTCPDAVTRRSITAPVRPPVDGGTGRPDRTWRDRRARCGALRATAARSLGRQRAGHPGPAGSRTRTRRRQSTNPCGNGSRRSST